MVVMLTKSNVRKFELRKGTAVKVYLNYPKDKVLTMTR
jgi:hypothetical protein